MPRFLMRIKDDDLDNRLNAMRAMIRRTRKLGSDTIEAEKELCWLEREEEWRQLRRDKDKIYRADQAEEKERLNKQEQEALKALDLDVTELY